MPAPKMTLGGVSLNQPAYGYVSRIHTGIKWDFVGDNYKGYDIGEVYFTNEVPRIMLDETMQAAIIPDFESAATLALGTDHGFYPFTPIFTDASYSVRLIKHEYTGLLKSPWKYSDNTLSMRYDAAVPAFTPSAIPVEGNVAMWDGDLSLTYVPTIREIDQPPGLNLPEYYNVSLTQSGAAYGMLSRNPAQINAGITADIEIRGSVGKMGQILLYLLYKGANYFYVLMPYNIYTSEPVASTYDPDYWLFGRKVPMQKYQCTGTGFARWFYGWKVRCVSNPIEVVHNYRNNLSIRLRLALVV